MRHPFKTACAAVIPLLAICASHTPAQINLQVLLKDGNQRQFNLSTIPKITFQSPNLVIDVAGGSPQPIHHSDVRKIIFETPTASSNGFPARTTAGLALGGVRPIGAGMAFEVFLTRRAQLHLAIFSLDGSLMTTFGTTMLEPGVHTLYWEGRSNLDWDVEPGTYLLQVKGLGTSAVRSFPWIR